MKLFSYSTREKNKKSLNPKESLMESDLPLLIKESEESLIKSIVTSMTSTDPILYDPIWDELFEKAAELIFTNNNASTSFLQRELQINYNRAGIIIDQLEACKIIGPFQDITERKLLVKNKRKLDSILKQISLDRGFLLQFYKEHNSEIESLIVVQESSRTLEIEYKREPIPQEVKDKVWNRDGGRCVKCGSRENLEFDHIIPLSKGGANTYRNIQLLCEKRNREKSNKIG